VHVLSAVSSRTSCRPFDKPIIEEEFQQFYGIIAVTPLLSPAGLCQATRQCCSLWQSYDKTSLRPVLVLWLWSWYWCWSWVSQSQYLCISVLLTVTMNATESTGALVYHNYMWDLVT